MTEFVPVSELLTEDALKTRFNEKVEDASRKLEFKIEISTQVKSDEQLVRYILDKKEDLIKLGYMVHKKGLGAFLGGVSVRW